jgi:hypothetical protein
MTRVPPMLCRKHFIPECPECQKTGVQSQVVRIEISDLVRDELERKSAAIQRLWKERDELRQTLQEATEALGRFCSGEDWTQADMETLDRCHARLLGWRLSQML